MELSAGVLAIDGVSELLHLELDARRRKGRTVQVVPRAAQADEKRARAHRLAEVQHQLALRALHAELGALHERRTDVEYVAQEAERVLVEVREPLPFAVEDRAQVGGIHAEEAGASVRATQRLE